MFTWSLTFQLISQTWFFELSENCSVKEFRLFVFSVFISSLLLAFEFWALLVTTKNIQSLRELSWAVLSLYFWFIEWMSFFLLQHLAKWPFYHIYCKFYILRTTNLTMPSRTKFSFNDDFRIWITVLWSVMFSNFINVVNFRILYKSCSKFWRLFLSFLISMSKFLREA